MKKLILVVAVIFTIALSAFAIQSTPKATLSTDKATIQQADFIAQSPMGPKANLSQADIN